MRVQQLRQQADVVPWLLLFYHDTFMLSLASSIALKLPCFSSDSLLGKRKKKHHWGKGLCFWSRVSVVAAEERWKQQSGLVLMLPHGETTQVTFSFSCFGHADVCAQQSQNSSVI